MASLGASNRYLIDMSIKRLVYGLASAHRMQNHLPRGKKRRNQLMYRFFS